MAHSFSQILMQVLESALGHWHGLNSQTFPVQYPNGVQQGLLSVSGRIIKNPLFQQVALTEHQSHCASPTSRCRSAQHHLHLPWVIQLLPCLLNVAPVQDRLDAHAPDVQQGIMSDVLSVFKKPAFQQFVSAVVDTVLTHHGINPVAPVVNGTLSSLTAYPSPHALNSPTKPSDRQSPLDRVAGAVFAEPAAVVTSYTSTPLRTKSQLIKSPLNSLRITLPKSALHLSGDD